MSEERTLEEEMTDIYDRLRELAITSLTFTSKLDDNEESVWTFEYVDENNYRTFLKEDSV